MPETKRLTNWSELTFAIIGLGLIGGSYALALRRLGVKSILGYNRSPCVSLEALSCGMIDVALHDNDARLKEADVIVMAIYPEAIVSFLQTHQSLLKSDVLITDAAGIKNDLGEKVQAILQAQQEFISGHPMAGRQGKGLALADEKLFDGANYIVVKNSFNSTNALNWLHAFARAIGFANTIEVTPQEHDQIIAYTSDLTHITAAALINSTSFDDKTAFFTAGSFRDATRVADINPDLWTELLMANRGKITLEVDRYINELKRFNNALESADDEAIRSMLQQARSRKHQLNDALTKTQDSADSKRGSINDLVLDDSGHFKVACFGSPGSFTHQALDEYFEGKDYERLYFNHFEEVIDAVTQSRARFGVLPIENSSTGGITEVYDLLRKNECVIVGERCLQIQQNLLACEGATLGTIKRVYSHPQGLAQSKEFFKSHPKIETIADFSTSKSAQMVSDSQDPTLAAIAGNKAAERYGLKVLVARINSNSNNRTRFVIIAKGPVHEPEADKITLVLTVKHEPGSLYKALGYFYHAGLNLMNIESRPIEGRSWEYFFHIDVKGNLRDPAVNEGLKTVQNACTYFKILGNYKAH